MTLDEHFHDQLSRGQPPMVALDNAAQAYAEELSTKDFLTHDLIKKLPKGWTTLYARYDELEEWLRFLGSRTYRIVHFNEFVHIVIGPEESTKQCQCRTGPACKPTCTCHDGYQSRGCDRCGTYGLPDCSQYADETAMWDEHQDSDEVAIHQRLRTFISSTLYGGCRVFSVGDQCQCPLCDLDRLFQLTNRSKDSEAVELLREQCQRMKKDRDNGGCLTFSESAWFYRVMIFLEGKQ